MVWTVDNRLMMENFFSGARKLGIARTEIKGGKGKPGVYAKGGGRAPGSTYSNLTETSLDTPTSSIVTP